MFKRTLEFLAMGAALLALTYPQTGLAETFKASDFLKWQLKSQTTYIRTSVGMASLIAGRNSKQQGECLDEWYFNDTPLRDRFILDTMKRVPDYHPRAVILAVLEKQCGSLVY